METKHVSPKMMASFSPFNRLDADELFLLAGRTEIRNAHYGDLLVKIGDSANKSLYLLQGKLLVRARDGKESFIDTRDIVPREPISHLVPHNYDVVCMSDVHYFLVNHKVIENTLTRFNTPANSAEVHHVDESCFADELFTEIYEDLIEDNLSLPRIVDLEAEVQMRIDANAPVSSIVPLLIMDPSMAAYIMRMANSPIFVHRERANTLGTALKKIYSRKELSAIIHRASKSLYVPFEDKLYKNLSRVWRQGLEVGVIASKLISRSSGLDPDVAFNYGLFHNIGMYLVYLYAYQRVNTVDDSELPQTVMRLHKDVARIVLKRWNFPGEYIELVDLVDDWGRSGTDAIDYADALTLARVLSFLGKNYNRDTPPVDPDQLPRDISKVPSLAKFGFTSENPDKLLDFLTGCRKNVAEYQNNVVSLGGVREFRGTPGDRSVVIGINRSA